jgi:hypothetical protein
MNYLDRYLRETSSYTVMDVMLADIAVRIQLTPTDYQKAVDHADAINEWMDREDSPLHGKIQLFYAQGGFAISAATARHDTDADFDIDLMAQLNLPPNVDPEAVLAVTHKSIKGEKSSRYYEKCERKTRCSTVHYEGMHLDVTPAVRILGTAERTSIIFHSKPTDPSVPKQSIYANPHGFAEWFIANTPADEIFGQYFEKTSLDYNRFRLEALAKADSVPVPAQAPVYRKSRALICLQLIKRWRNIAYDRRHAGKRMPPSVLLSFYVAKNANRATGLMDELLHQVECMIVTFERAEKAGGTVREFNPTCAQDELTDRWPCDLKEQRLFINELRAFAVQLHRLKAGAPLAEMRRILEDLFGERPAGEAIRKYTGQHDKDNVAGKSVHILRAGSIPALGSVAVPAAARSTPKSSPWGD